MSEQVNQEEMVKGVYGSLVAKSDYEFVTRCADIAWNEMVQFYGPDGIEEIRRGLSRVGIRRFTADVLNAANLTHDLVPRDSGRVVVDRARFERLLECARSYEFAYEHLFDEDLDPL